MFVCTVGEVELDVVAAQELLRQQARVGVIVGQAFDVVGERVRPRGREDARLAHRAAGHAPVPMGALDEVLRAGEHRAGRGAETLAERQRDEVESARQATRPASPLATAALRIRAPSR